MRNRVLVRTLLAALLAYVVFATPHTPPVAHASSDSAFVVGQLVVRIDPMVGTIGLLNAQYGTTTLGTLSGLPVYLLQLPAGTDELALARLLTADPMVEYAEPNYQQRAPEYSSDDIWAWGGSDPTPMHNTNSTRAMHLDDAHEISQGAGTLVAVLDTGAQRDHPAFGGQFSLVGYDFVENDLDPSDTGNGVDDDGNGLVDEAVGHGTHVAALVALTAPQAELLAIRVLDSDGAGNNFWTAQGMLLAIEHEVDVINMSFGAPYQSALLSDMLKNAAAAQVVVVAAAGNGNLSAPRYPAADACAIGVTSVDRKDRKSSFANYGSWIDLAAPGEEIYSAVPIDSYAWWSGTSMATPFISGQVALLRGVDGALGLDEIGMLIGGTADSLDKRNSEYRGQLGHGRPDIGASVEALVSDDDQAGAFDESANLFTGCQP